MKAQKSKIFLTIALTAIVVLTAVFAFSSCSEEHVHTFNEVVVAEATCTEAGKLNKVCTDEECGYVESLVIPAIGHDTTSVRAKEPTCISVGYVAHDKCTREGCGWTTLDASGIKERLNHTTVRVNDLEKESPRYKIQYPTCTESGYHYEYYECTNVKCQAVFDPEKKIDDPLGHRLASKDAKAASCTIGWDAFEYCDGWTTTDLREAGYRYMPAIASSGPVPGKGCGYNTYVEHPAIYPHVMSTEQKYIETKAPTCASEGAYKTVLECVTCSFVSLPDNYYNWNPNYKPGEDITGTGTIPKLDHEWQTHGEKIPDNCYTDGWEEFNMCSKCSQITDKDGNTLDEIPAIPAGHEFDSDGCLIVCDRCGFIDLNAERGGHSVVVEVEWLVQPTCYKSGKYECTKKCVHPDCKQTLSVEIVEIEPHGHDIVKHPAKAPDCTSVGWNEFETCSRCGYSTFAEIEKKGHNFDITNPIEVERLNKTCVSDGYHKYYYVCTVCNAEDHHNDPIPAGHESAPMWAVQPTCDAPGHSAYEYCTACGTLLSAKETYQPIGHVIQKVPAQNATCTNNGWHDYIKCTREGCTYSTQAANTITALGHNMRTVEVIKAATCTTEGTYKSTSSCTACGYVDAEASIDEITTGPALGHNYLNNGYCERYSQCGERYSVGLAYVKNSDGTYTVAGMGVCNDYELIIPDEYNGAKVVAIAEKAFAEKYEITSVKIGKNVTEIGQMAFYYCKNIKTVTIGESVIKVGANAFRGCAAITKTYYTGSNWGAIYIGSWNEDLTSKY